MVECQPSKLAMRVRFPSPAPPPMPETDGRIFPKACAAGALTERVVQKDGERPKQAVSAVVATLQGRI